MTEPAAKSHCPWCDKPVPKRAARCPSCGAALRDTSRSAGGEIPGLTRVDPVIGAQRRVARPNRLVGWLANVDLEPDPMGGTPTSALTVERAPAARAALDLEAAGQASVAPPSEEVRREIARLELEALKAELEAHAVEVPAAELRTAEAPVGEARPAQVVPTEDDGTIGTAEAAGPGGDSDR